MEQFQTNGSQGTLWDVVVVGAGMGGSVRAGRWLVRTSVSCISNVATPSVALRKLKRATSSSDRAAGCADSFGRESSRRFSARANWGRRITVRREGKTVEFYPPMGTGPGGAQQFMVQPWSGSDARISLRFRTKLCSRSRWPMAGP